MPDPELSFRMGNAERRLARIEALLGLDKTEGGREGVAGSDAPANATAPSPDPEGPEHVTCPTCKGRGWRPSSPFPPCDRCGGEGRLRVWVLYGKRLVVSGEERRPEPGEYALVTGGPSLVLAYQLTGHYPILVPAPAPDPEHHNTPAGVREDRSEEDEPRTTTYQDLEGGIDSTGTSYPDSARWALHNLTDEEG